MNLEKEILDELSTKMQSEIDREIMWSMLKNLGWRRVILDRYTDNNHAVDIRHWLALNTKKSYECNGRDFIFEDARDANWFVLRWGTQ